MERIGMEEIFAPLNSKLFVYIFKIHKNPPWGKWGYCLVQVIRNAVHANVFFFASHWKCIAKNLNTKVKSCFWH